MERAGQEEAGSHEKSGALETSPEQGQKKRAHLRSWGTTCASEKGQSGHGFCWARGVRLVCSGSAHSHRADSDGFRHVQHLLSPVGINVTKPPFASHVLQLDAESDVNNEMANRMSLFYAEATPMLKTLSNATTKFVSEVSEPQRERERETNNWEKGGGGEKYRQ